MLVLQRILIECLYWLDICTECPLHSKCLHKRVSQEYNDVFTEDRFIRVCTVWVGLQLGEAQSPFSS